MMPIMRRTFVRGYVTSRTFVPIEVNERPVPLVYLSVKEENEQLRVKLGDVSVRKGIESTSLVVQGSKVRKSKSDDLRSNTQSKRAEENAPSQTHHQTRQAKHSSKTCEYAAAFHCGFFVWARGVCVCVASSRSSNPLPPPRRRRART